MVLKFFRVLTKLSGWIESLYALSCCWLSIKLSTADNLVSLRAKRSGVFATVVSGFTKFLSEGFTSVWDSTVLSMLFGLNKLAVLLPIVGGFSLLPFKNFDNIGLILWHSDKNKDGYSSLCGRGCVLWENDNSSGLLASGISFIDGEHLREVGHLAVG